ncbi:MAG: hypothetical protein Q9214_005001 [Letrouitia sp. 1 TL-2023]
MDTIDASSASNGSSSAKRKRSPSLEIPAPPVKVAKTHSNHLQINYLARQYQEILPLISSEDTLPALLNLIADYDGVLQRHESMAGNLGARPLGPILIKRFERLFESPPKVLKTHGKEGTTVGWLDVVEFARNKPEQFNLEKMRDGVRVCQFYTKQSRVEISEEDYVLIASGMPQKLIPPQPIVEDEEKELGTLEILEKNLGGVVQLADQVSARARQLNHRLKNRKNAIISRREAEAASNDDYPANNSPHSANYRGSSTTLNTNGVQRSSISPTGGFVAVNHAVSAQELRNNNGYYADVPETSGSFKPNGASTHTASAATRAELMSKFFTNSDRSASTDQDQRSAINASRSSGITKNKVKTDQGGEYSASVHSTSPVPIPNTPSSLLPYAKPSQLDRYDDSGPYKSEMMARMEQLNRGDRVQPPCDRCRRLHMDCLKNLTACMGCTKKHAKCSWKDVTKQELIDNPIIMRSAREAAQNESAEREKERDRSRDPYRDLPTIGSAATPRREYPREEQRGVRDEELLGEDASADEEDFPRGRERSGYHYHPAHEGTNPSPPSPPPPIRMANMTSENPSSLYITQSVEQPLADSAPAATTALPSPPKEQDPSATQETVEAREYNATRPSNGFQSVNPKGLTEQHQQQKELRLPFGGDGHNDGEEGDLYEEYKKQERDRERMEALVQLSAAAREMGRREGEVD